ncbi:hypothetical protein ACTU3I_16480 [Microbacterium sp. RD1]|uniref:hypothetical protein n=1 Tax=Microbacterium sp. RD1 TaxID=3457313 RepID=UPI003FA5EE95
MSSNKRQRIERVPGSRRAKLTPAPGTGAEPVPGDDADAAQDAASGAASGSGPDQGPNDERMRRDVPPHY